jgi:hypothetical protein
MKNGKRILFALFSCALLLGSLLMASGEAWARPVPAKNSRNIATVKKSKRAKSAGKQKAAVYFKKTAARTQTLPQKYQVARLPQRPKAQVARNPNLPVKYQEQRAVDQFPTPYLMDTNRDLASVNEGTERSPSSPRHR